MLRRLAQAKFLICECNVKLLLIIPSRHAFPLRNILVRRRDQTDHLLVPGGLPLRTRALALWIEQSAPGHHRLLPSDPGEITTKFHIELLIYINTWTEYKNQISLIVRTRNYSVSETHYLLRFAGYQPYPSGYVVISC